MKSLATALALAVLPLPAVAECQGQDYLQTLSAADTAALDAKVARTPYAQGLVWQAARGDDVATIIGTIHIFDERLGAVFVDVAEAVASADILLVEAGPEEEAQMQATLAADPSLIFITEGATLPDQLDEDVWQALADAARDRQIPAVLAAKMQPWYLALTLSIPACAMADISSGVRGLDHMLMQQAQESGVPIAALEPWDTLFAIMQDGTQAEQLEMLKLSLLPTELQTGMFVAMLNSYFAQDVARIWEASRLATRDVPGLDPDRALALFAQTEEQLLTIRNHAWIPEIDAAAASHDRIVIAVGAAHLPGENGVLRLMENEGWVITAMPR